jgi:hypothetical protein
MTEKTKFRDNFFFVEMSRINSSKICRAVYGTNEKAHWRPRKYRASIVNKNVYRPGFSRMFGSNLPLRTWTEFVQRFKEYIWQSPYMVTCQLGLNMDQHGMNWNRQTFCRNSTARNFTFYTLILVTDGQTLPPQTTFWHFFLLRKERNM